MTNRRQILAATAAAIAVSATQTQAAQESAHTEGAGGTFSMPQNATLINMRSGNGYTLGVKQGDQVLDVTKAGKALGLPYPSDMDDLLQNGLGSSLKSVIDAAALHPNKSFMVAESSVNYAPLVTRPEKIIMMGFNYRHHAEETGTPIPKNPPLFNKYNNALNHHGGTIKLPVNAAREFDYETELVIVFGRECHDVDEAHALDYVAGYATGNDFSARDLQTLTSQFMIGKTSDGFAPIGPYLVTADQVKDPNNLKLRTWVNGTIRQDWNTNDMIFNCRQLISFASKVMTIKPGDIFYTGTPQGVIFGEKIPRKDRKWLQPGDEIVSELEGLGRLAVRLV